MKGLVERGKGAFDDDPIREFASDVIQNIIRWG
jgi:hypothetical protein